MNANIARALFKDALYQVLDNMVFRILVVLILVLVLPLFLVGFREDEIVVLFYWHFPYADWMKQLPLAFGGDVQSATIAMIQTAFIDKIAGGVGMLFCIVATSFFMPRMLEKGFADTVFSKPLSRGLLLSSRYLAGILFVGLLSTVLVGGQYLGLTIVSGYSDPGFLFSIFTLIWLFMMLHAVSLLCGVMTRSAIASVMMVIVFYGSVGGIHLGWTWKELWLEQHEREIEAKEKAGNSSEDDEVGVMGVSALLALDTLHYVLPKTADAELIAKLFRRRYEMSSRELDDQDTGISVARLPEGYVREQRSSLATPDGLLWISKGQGASESHWTLRRQPLETKSRSASVRDFKKELAARASVSDVDSDRGTFGSTSYEMISWQEQAGADARLHKRWFFTSKEWLLTLDYEADLGFAQSDAERRSSERFLAGISTGDPQMRNEMRMEDPHERDFGWTARWKHNAWFSLGTTAAFILAALAFAIWRLRRIDF